jgi:hypothetical protein
MMDFRHAAYVGWVLGLAHRHGLPFEPTVDDDGNYTAELKLVLDTARDTHKITVVVSPPPEDWSLPDG